MIETYFVYTESLIMNTLMAKSKIRQERIAKVSTNFSEITKICEYISKKISSRIIFHNSSKKFRQQYNNIIIDSPKMNKKKSRFHHHTTPRTEKS